MMRSVWVLMLMSSAAAAEEFVVASEVGNSSATAIFDAKLGERISAVTSSVGCKLTYDEKASTVSGRCEVPLTAIRVDNDEVKTEHFHQWATQKKSPPAQCKLEARFDKVKVPALKAETPVPFEGQARFQICGRGKEGGGAEPLSGTVVLFPPGSYGQAKTVRIRALVPRFNRVAYRVGPQFTDGWLARVQSLAKVVAEEGTLELTLFAKPKTSPPME